MKHDSFYADERLFHCLAERSDDFCCVDDQMLFEQGDRAFGLHLVRSGEVVLQLLSPEGNVLSSYSALQGSILGLPAVIEKAYYTLSAFARKGSEIGFIDADTFHALIRADPLLYPAVMNVLATEVRAARAEWTDWSGDAARKREAQNGLQEEFNYRVEMPQAQLRMAEGI